VADGLQDDVGAAVLGAFRDGHLGVPLPHVHGLGADTLGQREPVLEHVEREDALGAAGEGGLDREEAHRAGADDGHRVPGAHPADRGTVHPGREDVPEEQRPFVVERVGDPQEVHVRVRDAEELGLRPPEIAARTPAPTYRKSSQSCVWPARQNQQAPHAMTKDTTTRSPTRTRSTPGPTASTTPTASCPIPSPGSSGALPWT